MRDESEVKMVRRFVCARTPKRGQTGRKIDQRETASGRGRTDMRAQEEAGGLHASFESSAGALVLNIH